MSTAPLVDVSPQGRNASTASSEDLQLLESGCSLPMEFNEALSDSSSTPKVTGLSHDEFLGLRIPLATYATLIFMSSQVTSIIQFFLSRNLNIARTRAWDQVVASRGKSPDFWGPYVEEWEKPPQVQLGGWDWERWVGGWIARYIIRNVLIAPISLFVPFAGIPISAALKSISTSRTLHAPYFVAKKMTPMEIAVYMEERKVDYYAFGFTAALLEMGESSSPIVGLFFSISNRIGAAMWAFDLEKRQHLFRTGQKKPKQPRTVNLSKPSACASSGARDASGADEYMVGGWKEGTTVVGGEFVEGEGTVKKEL
ncbi:hypothetical protein FRB99_001591 [Tulasnella sp. 403]|nr:hypothetical protein FRB99_001591 [Tulasnella sp. 403]